MKLEKFANRRGAPSRPPCRTTDEIADELGIEVEVLRFHLSRDEAAPKWLVNHISGQKVHSNRWYDRRAVIAWWKKRSEVKA